MKIQHILLGIFIAMIWGSNFVAVKFYTDAIPPFLATFLRLFGVFCCSIPFMTIPKCSYKRIYLCSLLYCVGFLGLSSMAVNVGASTTIIVILSQFSVPFSVILARIFFKENIPAKKY